MLLVCCLLALPTFSVVRTIPKCSTETKYPYDQGAFCR